MGTAASSLSRPAFISSGKDLLAQSKEVREMSDSLFKFMFMKWSLKEVWDIANKPEEYVIALSELIEKQFDVIGYTTERSKVGEIYFKRKESIKTDGPKHKENAQIIAFYFIRLFQIMGALLLVVKDINFPVYNPRTLSNNNSSSAPVTPSERPYVNQGTMQRFKKLSPSYPQYGGGSVSTSYPLGPYEFLRKYLKRNTEEEKAEYRRRFNIDISDMYRITPNLFFKHVSNKDEDLKKTQVKDYTRSTFYILLKDTNIQNSKIFKDQAVSIENINTGTGKQLVDFKTPEALGDNEKELYPISIDIKLHIPGKDKGHSIQFTRKDKDDSDFKGGPEYYITNGTKMTDITGRIDRFDFPAIMEESVLTAIRQNAPNLQLLKISEANSSSTRSVNIGKIPDKVDTSKVINDLLQDLKGTGKYQPHCIARALQLLDSNSIERYSPLGGSTKICKFVVGDSKTGTSSTVTLDAYKPLKSLANLYGTVNPSSFKDSQGVISAFVGKEAGMSAKGVKELRSMKQDDEADELAVALKRLAEAFKFVSKDPVDSFSQIQLSRPGECKTNEVIRVKNEGTTLLMQSAAQQLFAYHINNTIKISTFLQKIFNIKKGPTPSGDVNWVVEGPKSEILFAGFPLLDQITSQARSLLVDYYSGCEEVYQRGLKAWKDSDEVKGAAAAPAPSAPPASQRAAVAQPVASPSVVSPSVASPVTSPVTTGGRRKY